MNEYRNRYHEARESIHKFSWSEKMSEISTETDIMKALAYTNLVEISRAFSINQICQSMDFILNISM